MPADIELARLAGFLTQHFGDDLNSGETPVDTAIRILGALVDTAEDSNPRELVTIEEAAEHLNVSARTIRRWIATGSLPGYRVGPRFVKVDVAELDAVVRPITRSGVSA